ncbi:MAG: delta-60 repeat domain-containing protein [Gallionella sp.]
MGTQIWADKPGGFTPSCVYDYSVVDERTQIGGVLNLEKIWPNAISNGIDNASAYADETGVFWVSVGRYYDNSARDRPGIESFAAFSQQFTKDTDAAWAKFTISKASLSVDNGAGQVGGSGACATIYATAHVYVGGGHVSGDRGALYKFQENALLSYSQSSGWQTFYSNGPMTYTTTSTTEQSGATKVDVTFDPYTGYLDLSGIKVGETFGVSFEARAAGSTGFAELPALVTAYFRDPLSTGGGISIETEGLTPLNNAVTKPIPSDQAYAQVIQADGKIITAGYAYNGTDYDFAVARYTTDGSLDTSFDSDGKVVTNFGGGSDYAYAVALQTDGKLVVAGYAYNGTNSDFALARYNSDGSLDVGFGAGGKVTIDFGGYDDIAKAIAIQPDGMIVVAGYAWNGSHNDFALARFDSNGNLDTTYGSGTGKLLTDFVGASDFANAMVLQSDGKIVVAGSVDSGATSTKSDFALARYNTDGSLDTGFGTGGKITTDFANGSDFAEAIGLQSDGKIVAAGSAYNGVNTDFALARFDTAGNPDPGFGAGGKLVFDFTANHDYAHALAIQADGKIIAAGHSYNGANDDFAIARFDAAGNPDPGFGSAGKVIVDFSSQDDRAHALAIRATDGKIVAAGYAITNTGDDFALARLNP